MATAKSASVSNRGNGAIRDPATGHFLPGNPGGPGNPRLRILAEYREALTESVVPRKVGRVMRLLYREALKGNVPAMREFLDRTVGKAIPPSESDRQAKEVFASMVCQALPEVLSRIGNEGDAKAVSQAAILFGKVIQENAARERIVEVEGEESDSD